MLLSASLLKVNGKNLQIMIKVIENLEKRLTKYNHIILRVYLNCINVFGKEDLSSKLNIFFFIKLNILTAI